jgi:hypothetical protein
MIYLHKLKTKIFLVLLCGLIALNIVFVSSKNFITKTYDDQIANLSEAQYQNCLRSLSAYEQIEFINNTDVERFLNLPEETLYFFYLGYFLIAIGFILSTQFSIKNLPNENG